MVGILSEFDDNLTGYSDNYIYMKFWPSTGWDLHRFSVEDMYDVNRAPALLIQYIKFEKEYGSRIFFNGENYKYVNHYDIRIDGKTFLEFKNVDLTLDHFLNVADDGDILPKSEDKYIKILNRFLNLKAFI